MDFLPRVFFDLLVSSDALRYVPAGLLIVGLYVVIPACWMWHMVTNKVREESIEEYEARIGRYTRGRPGVL